MTDVNVSGVQPGWTVVSADGEELGSVMAVDQTVIHVKKGGLLGGQIDVPRDSVAEVETGRVEIGLTRKELESRR